MLAQIDHSTILDNMQQLSIVFILSTIKINMHLIRVSQFLSDFALLVCHKLGKEHIVLNLLNRLLSKNFNLSTQDLDYAKIDIFSSYSAMLVKFETNFL